MRGLFSKVKNTLRWPKVCGWDLGCDISYIQLRSFLEEVRCVVMEVQVSSGSSTDNLSLLILCKGRAKKNEGTVEL